MFKYTFEIHLSNFINMLIITNISAIGCLSSTHNFEPCNITPMHDQESYIHLILLLEFDAA